MRLFDLIENKNVIRVEDMEELFLNNGFPVYKNMGEKEITIYSNNEGKIEKYNNLKIMATFDYYIQKMMVSGLKPNLILFDPLIYYKLKKEMREQQRYFGREDILIKDVKYLVETYMGIPFFEINDSNICLTRKEKLE